MSLSLRDLREQLVQFGLNPSDWSLEIVSQFAGFTRMEVRSRGDSLVCFEGWAGPSAGWLALSLCEV